MTIKDELLKVGMKENEIGTHCSDLHVLKNDISTNWVNNYQFKMNVTTFKSQIDNLIWYDIPFAYMDEYITNRKNLG